MQKTVWISITVVVWLMGLATWRARCEPAWFAYGISIDACPDGELRQTAELAVSGVRRGGTGQVRLQAIAHYTTREADGDERAAVPRISDIALTLTGAEPSARPLEVGRWTLADASAVAELALPDVPDGDYQLHASYRTALGSGEVSATVAVYAPARIHVITDRPLYQPGDTVRFRAVVLRARDLVPLDHRPGTWVVRDPENEVLLEEAAPAGDWGVAAGSFPLDRGARSGQWRIAWRSADAVDEVAVTVAPFTLPRFRVDASADRPFYRPGDRPSVKGAVAYSSGAPVAGARLDVEWEVSGAWPPPTDWQAHVLPRRAETAASGRFELALPAIPDDLQGQVALTARISAVDPAGDRAVGVARLLLSKDGIQASAVTELGDGLVESFNNRLYLRIATPDGRVLPEARITVRRAWLPGDRGIEAVTDEDGVASLQIDPGAPVNVVIPALPFRPEPRPPLVTRGNAQDLIGGRGASLADQVELDRWLPALAACARWVDGGNEAIKLALRVDAGGAVVAVGAGPSPVARCAVAVARGRRLAAGAERLYAVELAFVDPGLPRLIATVEAALDAPAELTEQIAALARSTRDCLPHAEGRLPSLLTWRVAARERAVAFTGWVPDAGGAVNRAAQACVESRFAGARVELPQPAESDGFGVVRFAVEVADQAAQGRPQPTTMLGYELAVTAEVSGRPQTVLRMQPGEVPPLRLRVAPVLAQPGQSLSAQLYRGPQFTGALPGKLALDCPTRTTSGPVRAAPDKAAARAVVEAALDAEHRAQLAIADDVEGWCTVSGGGVQARVYVRPRAELSVSVSPGRERYAPGEQAELAIHTTLGGKGGPAAVGLFGVDDSLGQLVPLPDADGFGRVRPAVETRSPAFGVLDGQALVLGRIRGANAAAATVLRVSSVPAPAELDAVVAGRGASRFDPVEELTDRF
jgi:hypothetical protein